jgi:hypothetical protein
MQRWSIFYGKFHPAGHFIATLKNHPKKINKLKAVFNSNKIPKVLVIQGRAITAQHCSTGKVDSLDITPTVKSKIADGGRVVQQGVFIPGRFQFMIGTLQLIDLHAQLMLKDL